MKPTLILCALLLAADMFSAPLPPAAQESFDKGVRAARQQEWKLAVRYLDEARQAAPDDPVIHYNLALAEAQLSGREYRAIAWFESYLALRPQAENVAAVRSQISDLELRGEANMGRVIEMARSLAVNFSEPSSRMAALKRIGTKLVESGDYSGAIALARTFDLTTYEGTDAMQDIAIALGAARRYDDADRLIADLPRDDVKSWAHCRISMYQSEAGQLSEARTRLARIANPSRKTQALRDLARAEFKAGRKEAAAATLAEAKAISQADKQNFDSNVSDYFKLHLELEDWAGARALLPLLSDKDPDHLWQTMARNDLAAKMSKQVDVLLGKGDLPGAEALVDDIPGLLWRVQAQWNIAVACHKSNQPEKLAAIQTKLEAAYQQAPRAREGVIIGGRLAQLTALRGDQAAAAQWRLRAIEKIAPAVSEPNIVWMDSSKVLGGDFKAYEHWHWLYVSIELCSNLSPTAISTADEKSLRAILTLVKKAVPVLTHPSYQGDFAEAGLRASVKLAQLSSRPADREQALACVQQYSKYVASYKLKDVCVTLIRHFWNTADFPGALRVINATADAELRQRMLDKHHEKEFAHRLELSDWSGARQAMEAISYKYTGYVDDLAVSKKTHLLRDMSDALQRIGDWSGSEKILASLHEDPSWRTSLLNSLQSTRIRLGDTRLESQQWATQRASLPAPEKRTERLAAIRSLVFSSPNVAELRPFGAEMFTLALGETTPAARLSAMRQTADAAGRLGQFEIQRTAQIIGLNSLLAVASPDWINTAALLKSGTVTDALSQPSARWRPGLLAEFIKALALNGNPDAAEKLLPQLPADLAEKLRLPLAEAYCALGDIAAAQAIIAPLPEKSSDRATFALLLTSALLTAGRKDEAKALAAQAVTNESLANTLLTLLIEAGEAEWVQPYWERFTSTVYRDSLSAKLHPALAAATKDWSKVTAQFRDNWYYKANFVEGVAKAGNPELAQQLLLLPEYVNFTMADRARANGAVVAALARQGEYKKAEKLAATITRNDTRFEARCAIAAEQAKAGQLEAARQTWQNARRQDPRTPAGLDVPAWTDFVLTEALAAKPDFAQALTVAVPMTDAYWRERALKTLAGKAAGKDTATARNALLAIQNELVRYEAVPTAMAACLRARSPAEALSLLDLATDPGYQAVGLRLLLNHAITNDEVAAVLPRLLALPPGPAQACLLNDLLKAHVVLGLTLDPIPVFAAASQSTNALASGLLQVHLLSELAHFAPRVAPAEAPALQAQALAASEALPYGEAALWQQFGANVATAAKLDALTAALVVTVPDPLAEEAAKKETANRRERSRAWINLAEHSFSSPLHLDFRAHLEGLPGSVPANSSTKAWDIFYKVDKEAYELLEAQKKIRKLRTEQSL